MAPLSVKIILDDGAITRTLMFDSTTTVREAHHIVRDKILTLDLNKEYGFFLASADNECSGEWLDDGDKTLEYYMLRDGDSLHYLLKIRNLRLRMLDGAVKTLQLDESKKVVELMVYICEKLRISHSEEYGLCREETESTDDSKLSTGTLTLKKKTIPREKDAKLEQLSKKLKTDDLVEWLDQHKTLRELKVDPQETLLFKRRLFYSDRNVDSRDPVQLNLLYVQTRDGILEGKQVVTETKALEFAGLQCQIQFGDYQEDKHKPGFIQNLKEFLPEQYVSWGVEKKTIKEHKKHVGVSEIEAKHLYTKMARELPTYGVTFFLVKEKQIKKKKLVPRLLGINAQSILRLDEETKEIIQVWLLTQVKSYRADYESFALNFGDYSEKEYVVKTNEGFRIKDILEGYIDIIRRSLAAPRKVNFTEGEAMYEDNIERSRGTTIQNFAPSKIMQTSLVGPSKILSVDQGQQAKEGTQLLTINELVKTNLGNKSQQPMISQQAERQFNKRHLSSGFENTMKVFNSKCVTAVVYLSDPNQQNIDKTKQAVAYLEDALPGIIQGIKETAEHSSPLKSKILLNNLDDLIANIKNLSYETKNSDLNNEETLIKAQNAAKNVADISTQIHLSLDPNTKRRSKILMRSRDSFIQDEKTEASLRRASFLVATDNAWTAVESAANLLDAMPEGVPSHVECKQLKRKIAYDLGKLQATIAMILNSHADPANIDYDSASISMKSLSETMPLLIQDIKHLITVGDEETGQDLKKYVRQLLDCTRAMCMLTGSDNVNKMFDVGNDYADVCKKITENLIKYDNGSSDNLDSQNNEIVKQVQNVGNKVQLLLMGTSELTKLEASDPRATELDSAGIKCTDATECLIACARLTLPSIHEPHSKSALTAATENITSSAQNMALLWKSLSEKPNRKSFAKQLTNSTFQLAKTLDKLRNEFSNIRAIDEESEESKFDKQRLKFIATARSADKIMTEANVQLQNMSNLPVTPITQDRVHSEHPELRNNLSQKLAHLNAAVAALVQAMGDPNCSDYGKAETAVDIISKLIPEIISDSKYLNGQVDETTWKNISEYLKEMLEASRVICENAQSNESSEESRNNAASKYVNASRRLTYIYNPRKKCERENQIIDLSKSALEKISQMLTRVNDLVETVGSEDGDLLDNTGVNVVASAQNLLKIAEITAPNINEVRCQEPLLSAIDHLSHVVQNLKNIWTPMLESPEHKQSKDHLNNNFEEVNKTLNDLREACSESDDTENQKVLEHSTLLLAANSDSKDANRQLREMTASQIIWSAKTVVDKLSSLLSETTKVANDIGGEHCGRLQKLGDAFKSAATQLHSTAELNASSMNNSQSQDLLVSVINDVSAKQKHYMEAWKPFLEVPKYIKIKKELQDCMSIIDTSKLEIAKAVNELLPETEALGYNKADQLQATVDSAKIALSVLNNDLKYRSTKPPNVTVDKDSVTKKLLTQKISQLNAALASIIKASTDPDAQRKVSAVKMFSALVSDICESAKHLHGPADTQTWNATLESLKTIVDASDVIYNNIQDNPKNVDSAVTTVANSAALLRSMHHQSPNTNKENQIQHLSRCAVEQISLLLPHVYCLVKAVGGNEGTELDQVGVKVVDGAKQFLKTTQITASTVDNPECKDVILSSVDHLQGLCQELKKAWEPCVETPNNHEIKSQLDQNFNLVNTTLEKIRTTCLDDGNNSEIQEKLQNLNILEAKEKLKDAERLLYEEKNAPDALNKSKENPEKPVYEQRMQLTQKIAHLNKAMGLLLQAMLDRKNPDYETIKNSVEVISNLTPDVIKDTMALQVKLDDESRQILFQETKSICKANQEVCGSIENNSLEELLERATQYAQASGKLLHIVSVHKYPNKERKILELSRNACERTSLLLSRLSRLARLTDEPNVYGEDRAQELESVGITVADAAHALLTNAQITAPSINEENCQAVLLSSVEKLSDLTQSLKDLCHPVTHNGDAQDIEAHLQRDLTLLYNDIAELKTACRSDMDSINIHHQDAYGTLSKKIELESQSKEETDHILQDTTDIVGSQVDLQEKLVIEDTPLRQLAMKILESVKKKVKSNSLPHMEQKEFEKLSYNLSAAINTMDLCNSRSINNPNNSRCRQDLEIAIMNLQQICLLSNRKSAHNNVVDLTDYVDEVVCAVRNFLKSAENVHLEFTDQGKEALEELRNKCKKIQENENKLQNSVTSDSEAGNIIDNMIQIDQFAKDCDDQVHEMDALLLKIDNETARNALQDELQYLIESCNLLRFAAKSSISSAAGVECDENIQNLESFKNKLGNILEINTELQNLQDNKMPLNPLPHALQSAQMKLTAAILSRNKNNLPKELTRYAVTMQSEMSSRDGQIKLKKHLQKLIDLLKLQIIANSRRVATWQDVENNNSIMNENVLEELETFSSDINLQKSELKTPLKNIIPMLLSNKHFVEGEPEELKQKLSKQIQKLNSAAQTVALGVHKPEIMSRSLHMTLDAAKELTAISKGLKGEDLLQNKKIEEATQEVELATYNLITTSELLSQVPVPDSRRKLLDACRSLNEALNKIARTTCPSSSEYCELQRDLQLTSQLEGQCTPPSAPLLHCLEQMQSQLELINIIRSSEDMTNNSRNQLRHITSAVCNGSEIGAQCACLLTLSDEDKHFAHHGVIDRYRISKVTDAIQDTCLQIICSGNREQPKELEGVLNKQINQLQESLEDNSAKVNDDQKNNISEHIEAVHIQFKGLQEAINSTTFREKEILPRTFKLMDAIKKLNVQIDRIPRNKIDDSPKKKETAEEVIQGVKKLINDTSTMIKKASCCEDNTVTWENIGGNNVIQAFEALISCIKIKGAEAGLIKSEEPEMLAKSYVQKQIDLTNTWLTKPASKEDKVLGIKAAESILELAENMCEDLGEGEQDELRHVVMEAKQLLTDCATKYNSDKASHLRERLHDARKLCERGAVTRVVEAFLHEPQHELEQLVHEPDEKKRKFLLEKKIAELLEHLARVTKTARFVADTGVAPRQAIINSTNQVELLAPALVKAAEKRISHLDDQVAIENYQKLLANYAESLTKIRDLCDRSVDPIDFSRAAGETIHRIKEESSRDPQKCVQSSRVIIKLGNRVVDAGLQAPLVRKDAELQRTLADIKGALDHHEHMGDVAAEILKKTNEVESALGGENIFQKEPDSEQPIYTAALQLHASLRGWNARHNDAVDGAKLLAVLMARLSHYMETDNKRELIITSKAIVDKSREIAKIATKLATECTDMRIRTNLLQVCERIPTISGQLKMLTTVKSSSLGQQGSAEDKEAMNMLVGNAQNLMISIQEVVKAAESASVKIMSTQRGYRMKWVQRNYY